MSNTNTFAAEILMRYGTPYSMELKLRTLGLCQNEVNLYEMFFNKFIFNSNLVCRLFGK